MYKLADGKPPVSMGYYQAFTKNIQDVLKGLHSGTIKPEDINPDLWQHNVDNLLNATGEGYGSNMINLDYNHPDYKLLCSFQKNVFQFAGAKSYKNLRDLNSLLIDNEGNLIPYSKFKKQVNEYKAASMKISDAYNKNYLYSEYQTALKQSQHAANWQRFEQDKDIMSNLKYQTTKDSKVRDEHEALDGVIKPINDKFWDTYAPQNDWGCRCYLEQTDEKPTKHKVDLPPMSDTFKVNVGKTGNLFNEKHPYFHTSKSIQSVINSHSEELALKYKIDNNRKIYNAYKNDGYVPMGDFTFNEKTGGFVMKHKKAQALKLHEKNSINKLYVDGERVVLPEFIEQDYLKKFDLLVNEAQFEMKNITGNLINKLPKRIKEAAEQTNNVVVNVAKDKTVKDIKAALKKIDRSLPINMVIIYRGNKRAIITMREIVKKELGAIDILDL